MDNENVHSAQAPIDREELMRMLDITYELEGLLHLALNRDEVPERIEMLVRTKVDHLNKITGRQPVMVSAPESTNSYSLEEEAEEERHESEELRVESEDIIDKRYEIMDKVGEIEDNIEDIRGDIEEDTRGETEVDIKSEKVNKGSAAIGVPVFSINDRFLYSRELFGGNVAVFEGALKEIASMDCYEEAEEYFITEHHLDPEQPVVQDFLAVIGKYFN